MIRILYVDDEDALLDVCKEFLERSGEMNVETASSAKEALKKMSLCRYDAVISDYQMPDTNGIDFLKEIRSNDDLVPFILFTGRGREEVVIEALNSGADFYIQKGGDPSSQFIELGHKVKEAVRRNRAENALKLNEARLNKAQAIGMTGCWEFNFDTKPELFWGSDESFRIFGYPRSSDWTIERDLIEECIVEREYAALALRQLIENGAEYNLEYHVIPADGSQTRIVRSMAELVKDPEGRSKKVVGVLQDVTERRKAEAGLRRLNNELMAIKECDKAMVRARTEQELVKDVCNIVCEMAGSRTAWIGMAEHDEEKTVRPVAWSGEGQRLIVNARVTWGDEDTGHGMMGTAIKTGRTAIMKDILSNPTMNPWREELKELGCGSMIAIPMLDSGEAFGALGIYIEDPEGFSKEEIGLLEEMTGDLSFGILGLRTKERQVRAEEALKRSDERFRTLFEEAPMAMSISLDGNIRQSNRRFQELFGFKDAARTKDWPIIELVAPRERTRILSLIANEKPGGLLEVETVGLRKDGSEFSLHSIFTTVMISDKKAFLGYFRDMTEQERMRSMVKDSEEKYRMFIERSPLAFAVTDPAGSIVQVNPAFCHLLGCVAEELIGGYPGSLMPPEDRQAMERNIPSLQSNGKSSMTCRLRRNDGKLIPVSVFSVILPNGSAMAFIEDITERKEWEKRLEKNEQELRNSEEKFRTIFDRAALGITTTGLDGRPVDFNQRYLEMVGYAPEEIKKMNFEEFTHPDDVARNQVLFESIKAGAVESYELEKRYIRKNGECIWVHLFTNRLLDSFGQPERVLTIVEDITERKRFAETLRNSEEQYSKLVAAIPDFVIRTDMSGNIILVNETGLKRGGYRLDEIAGHNLLSFVAPEDIEKSIKNIERMVEGMLGPVEYRLIMKNGKKVLFEVNGDVLRTSDGSPTGLVFVCRDMTERRQLESRLREANRKLMINDSITRHDTVNKLMALQGYIDLMRMGRDDVKELDRLNRMDQIVGFLREQVNVTKEYQNIGVEDPAWQSVREVCMRAASQTHLGNVTLDVDVGDLQILADPLLFKVFYNLMDNSLRHGIKVSHIEVKEDHTENGTRIILSDDGVGISLDEKTNLFREGYGKVHGLGLFLSKEILDITGMTITETGELGKGARFEITVPEGSYRNGQDAPVG